MFRELLKIEDFHIFGHMLIWDAHFLLHFCAIYAISSTSFCVGPLWFSALQMSLLFDESNCVFINIEPFPLHTARQKSPATHPYGQTLRTTDPHNPASHPSPSSLDKGLDHADEVVTALPAGHERCSYCGTVMPSLRLLMHERHCAQSTFKCPICKYGITFFSTQ